MPAQVAKEDGKLAQASLKARLKYLMSVKVKIKRNLKMKVED